MPRMPTVAGRGGWHPFRAAEGRPLQRGGAHPDSVLDSGGINNEDGTAVFDAASRVTGNEAENCNGGGISTIGGEVLLNNAANVAGNAPNNRGGPNPGDLCANP